MYGHASPAVPGEATLALQLDPTAPFPAPPRFRGVGLFAISALAVACTYLVDPAASAIRCEPAEGQPNPCPSGLSCVEGVCVEALACDPSDAASCPSGQRCRTGRCVRVDSCTPRAEVCGDNIDNDCDGEIDEAPLANGEDVCGDGKDNDCDGLIDEGHDADGDQNQWCGDTSTPGGAALRDCDDTDPSVYYGAPELCDGEDNDCDGLTDEADSNKSLCEPGEECLGRCVAPSCAIEGSIVCGEGEMCDIATGACVEQVCDAEQCAPGEFCDSLTGACSSVKRDNGEPCGAHVECLSGSCIESASLDLTVRAERVCGQTCCSDADCGADERCFNPGTGARSCLPYALVAATPRAPALCTRDAQCESGAACAIQRGLTITGSVVDTRTNLTATACRDRSLGESEVGELCVSTPAECPSQVCAAVGSRYACTSTCGSSEDCADLRVVWGSLGRTYCRVVGTGSVGSAADDYVSLCVVARSSAETGPGLPGASCRSGGDCLDGACVGASAGSAGVCAPTCCNDAQCGLIRGAPSFCRPIAFGDHFETRCVQ